MRLPDLDRSMFDSPTAATNQRPAAAASNDSAPRSRSAGQLATMLLKPSRTMSVAVPRGRRNGTNIAPPFSDAILARGVGGWTGMAVYTGRSDPLGFWVVS